MPREWGRKRVRRLCRSGGGNRSGRREGGGERPRRGRFAVHGLRGNGRSSARSRWGRAGRLEIQRPGAGIGPGRAAGVSEWVRGEGRGGGWGASAPAGSGAGVGPGSAPGRWFSTTRGCRGWTRCSSRGWGWTRRWARTWGVGSSNQRPSRHGTRRADRSRLGEPRESAADQRLGELRAGGVADPALRGVGHDERDGRRQPRRRRREGNGTEPSALRSVQWKTWCFGGG